MLFFGFFRFWILVWSLFYVFIEIEGKRECNLLEYKIFLFFLKVFFNEL